MNAVADWLIVLLQDFKTNGPLQQVGLVFGTLLVISGGFVSIWKAGRKTFSELSDENERLTAAVDDLTADRKTLKAQV